MIPVLRNHRLLLSFKYSVIVLIDLLNIINERFFTNLENLDIFYILYIKINMYYTY